MTDTIARPQAAPGGEPPLSAAPAGLAVVSRVEHKYRISTAEAAQLEARLGGLLQLDACAGPEGYLVRSLYFDTPQDRDYRAREDGLYRRQKMRLRVYGDAAEPVKLECKRKRGDFQQKISLTLTGAEARALCRGDFTPLLDRGGEVALFFYRELRVFGYRPAAVVEYRRTAFCWPVNETRITLDRDVRACETRPDLFAGPLPCVPVLPGGAILEVKYNGALEPFIRRALGGALRTRTSFSKYGGSRRLADVLA